MENRDLITLWVLRDKRAEQNKHKSLKYLGEDYLKYKKMVVILDKVLGQISNQYSLMVEHIDGRDVIIESEQRKRFESVLSSFVIGLTSNERSIIESDYVQASCLLRQELETLSQLRHILRGTEVDGETPKRNNIEKYLKNVYRELCALTHVSEFSSINDLTSTSLEGGSSLVLPLRSDCLATYSDLILKALFSIHIILVKKVISELLSYVSDYINPKLSQDIETEELFSSLGEMEKYVRELTKNG
ncbi:hypothetical protein KY022_002121 [Vibrio parahaemolyticus]|uniref:hypothetical protein n=1 Tax=Vibrio parahaemolyticus TaxID=670 RepID=UPI00084A854F|nr:hypothetical protein [Vibrio parahaemolyticus]EHU0317757.1 hypothetical protein [Vibrio parahaemolyticus]ODW82020.1 hypothetical protein BBL92_01405 [Vibrio parahaemolyticus]